jgi:drug/metabolite transporter (DMT)-like permease
MLVVRGRTANVASASIPAADEPTSWLRWLVLTACAAWLFPGLAFIAFSYAPAAHGAVLMPGTLPFTTAVLAWWLLGEKIVGRRALGLGFILLGVAAMAVNALKDASAMTMIGDMIFPFASASWAFFTVLNRRWKIDPLQATIRTAIIGCLIYFPVYLALLPKNIMQVPLFTILWQGAFQGIVAFTISMYTFIRTVQYYGPVRTTMMTSAAPVLASLTAVPLLGELLSPWVLVGLVAVTAGVWIGLPKTASPADGALKMPTGRAS